MAQDEPLASAALAGVLARIDTQLARIEAALADRDMPADRLVIALRDHFGAAPLVITRPRPEARNSSKASLQSVGFRSSVRLERKVKAVHVDEAAVRYGRKPDARCGLIQRPDIDRYHLDVRQQDTWGMSVFAAGSRIYDAALAERLPPEDIAALQRVLRALSAIDQPAGARNVPPRLEVPRPRHRCHNVDGADETGGTVVKRPISTAGAGA